VTFVCGTFFVLIIVKFSQKNPGVGWGSLRELYKQAISHISIAHENPSIKTCQSIPTLQ
jgi:hypothetical protein